MHAHAGKLYAGGSFTNIGGATANRVAWSDGTNWFPLGSGVTRVANVNHIYGTDYGVFTSGYFTNIGGTGAWAVARWDWTDEKWHGLGALVPTDSADKRGLFFSRTINGYANFMCPYKDQTMVAGGYFTNSDYRGPLHYVAHWNGEVFTNMAYGFSNVVMCGAYDSLRDVLYVGGSFTNRNKADTSLNMSYVAEWTGTDWTNVGRGLGNRVVAMAVHPGNGNLYVAGWFTNYWNDAGQSGDARYVAMWDREARAWTNVGAGFNNWVYALAFDSQSNLIAGGSFTNTYLGSHWTPLAEPCQAQRVAKWDGTTWTNIGLGLSDTVLSLAAGRQGEIYASGFFRTAYELDGSSTQAWYVAKYAPSEINSPGIEPSSGSVTGGYPVTISGLNLGDGTDITNVTLCGVGAAAIISQTETQVVIAAGASGVTGLGDVRLFSTSYGETVKSNAFTYAGPVIVLRGTNQVALTSGAAASVEAGTDFGTLLAGAAQTNRLTIANAGDEPLTLTGWTTNGSAAFSVLEGPVVVAPGSVSNLTVAFVPETPGAAAAELRLAHNAAASPFRLNLAGERGKRDQAIAFPEIQPQRLSAVVGLAALASSTLPVSFSILDGPGSLADGTNLSFTSIGEVRIVATQAGNDDWNTAAATNTVRVFDLDLDMGPFAGGSTITLTNAHFGTVTNLLVGNAAAVILGSGDSWVTFRVPEVGTAGPADILIQTEERNLLLPAVYTVCLPARDLPLGALVYDTDSSWNDAPIVWRLVATNAGRGMVTLQTTASIGNRPYHDGSWVNQWGISTLRTWLNGDAFYGQFSPVFSGVVVRAEVPWTAFTASGEFASGVVTDAVAIASRTEWGGVAWEQEGTVFDWFADPTTRPDRLTAFTPSPMIGWTRSGMRAFWRDGYYNLSAFYIHIPNGLIESGLWTSDALGVIPVVRVGEGTEFAPQPDGRYRLYPGPLNQVILFPNPEPAQVTSNTVTLSATASSGYPVEFALLSGPGLVNGACLTFTGTGEVQVAALQPGNGYWNPAPPVTNTFTVDKATATVSLTNLIQVFTGQPRLVGVLTDPPDLAVRFTYDGATNAPIHIGAYEVIGQIEEPLWQGGATGVLVILQADQTIAFPAIGNQIASATLGLAATASSGLPVTFAVDDGPAVLADGTNLSFTGAGTVAIVAFQSGNMDWSSAPPVTNTFTVDKARATVTLTNLTQVFTGLPRTAGVLTDPPDLTVRLTYDGATNAPIHAGSYTVVGLVEDRMWQGGATGLLNITKAGQTIAFPAIGDSFWTNRIVLSATASSGLEVEFAVIAGPATLSGGSNLAFHGYGPVQVRAAQAGDGDWEAAAEINTFETVGPQLTVLGTNGAAIANRNEVSLADGTAFGESLIRMEPITHTFTLTNAGTGPMTLLDVATNGADAASFRLVEAPAAIPAGGQAPLRLAFAPEAGGALAASFVFTYDGTGVVHRVNVAGQGLGGGLAFDSNSLAFAGTYASNDPFTATLQLTNVGVSGFTYDCAVAFGPGAANWLTVAPAAGTVPVGGAVTLTNTVDTTGLNAGVYTATGTIAAADATNTPTHFVVTLEIARAPQRIAFTNPGLQTLSAETALTATAEPSGLPVTVTLISGAALLSSTTSPAVATYTAGGPVTVEASQAGNSNWLAADPVRQTWRAGYTLTVESPFGTVTADPDQAYYDDGEQVSLTAQPDASYLFSGWTGDAAGTTNPVVVTMNGDRTVTAAYSPIGPVVLPPSAVGDRFFTARWRWVDRGAPEGVLNVQVRENGQFRDLAGYEDRFVANRTEWRIGKLEIGVLYRYRVRRILPDGTPGPWSVWMKTRTGANMPCFPSLLPDGPVSRGPAQRFALTNLAVGRGTLSVQSSDPAAVKVTLLESALILEFPWEGARSNATLTLTLHEPESGLRSSYVAQMSRAPGRIEVIETSRLTNAGPGRVAQELVLENQTGDTVYGVRVWAQGLFERAWLLNRTGYGVKTGGAIREMPSVLPPGGRATMRLLFNRAYRKQEPTTPADFSARAILPPFNRALPLASETALEGPVDYAGRRLLRWTAVPNRLYTVLRSDDAGATWEPVAPLIRATANRQMWLDLDEEAPDHREYRVFDVGR